MRYRILGPLEVVDGERAVAIGGGKQRALLAFLILHANEIVSSERLVDELWGERPPATAAKIVQNYVSRLRKQLELGQEADGAGVLLTRGPGYVFRLERGELDLDQFETLVAEGREALRDGSPDEAARKLRDALGLWRGSALADVAYEPFAQLWIARLEESRLHALEDRIEADLAVGRHGEVIAELEALVAKNPLRERLRGLLMLALYRSGRQADALRIYQETRRELVEGLGIEPGPDLQRLNTAILRQEPSLDLPADDGDARAPEIARGERKRFPRLGLGRRARAGLVLAVVGVAAAIAAAVLVLSNHDASAPTIVAGNSVAVIDPATGRVTGTIPVGAHPTSIAVGESAVWVLNADDQTISRIDPETRAVKTFAIGTTPADLAAGAGAVWVGNQGTRPRFPSMASVSRLDPRTAVVTARSRLPRFKRVSSGFGTTSAGNTIAVGQEGVWVVNPDLTLSRLDADTGSVIATVRSVAANTIALGLGAVWVVNSDGTLARIDPRTNAVTTTIEVPSASMSAIAVGASAVWITDPAGGNVLRIDPGGPRVVMTTVPLSVGAAGIAVGEGAVWVSNGVDRSLTRIDPTTNTVVNTLTLDQSPLGVAAGAGAAWMTVAGETRARPSNATRQPLSESSCSEVFYERSGTPRFLIASDLPLQGGSRLQAHSIVEAIKLVLRQHDFKAGEYTVGYQSCDDSTAQAQEFEYEKCASNAHAYAETKRVLGVVGPYNSDCSFIEIPIANEAPGGPLALISPSNTAVGLTHPAPARSRGDLARLYPTGVRNFARVSPADDFQAAGLAVFARDHGLRRVFVLRDAGGGGYAVDFSAFFAATARKLGLEVVGERQWDAQASSYRRLSRSIRAAGADAVVLAGQPESNGRRLVNDLRGELGADVEILASDAFSRSIDVLRKLGPAGEGIYASVAIVPSKRLPKKGQDFLRRFRATKPGWLTHNYYWAPYGAQAAEVLLDAIARSDGTRPSVTKHVLLTEVQNGILGSFGFDANGDTTLNPITILRLGRGGPGISRLALDFAEGGTVVRVIRPPKRLLD